MYKNSKKTFQRLVEHINIGYYSYRCRDGVVLKANKGFVKILELDVGVRDVIGRSLSELLIYIEGEESIRERLRERKELRNYEYRFKTLTGKDKCVLHNSYMVRDPYTGQEMVEAFIEDVTEERLSYERMKESQERYRKLFSNSGDMVIICRLDDFVVEEINPVTEVTTGFSEDELVGSSLEKLVHPSHRKSLKQAKEDLLFRGTAKLEIVIVCRNGAYKEMILTLSTVELGEDRIAMAVIKDVSALVKDREEQKKRQKELEDFWRSSVEREKRIKDLRQELERVRKQARITKEEHDTRESGEIQ